MNHAHQNFFVHLFTATIVAWLAATPALAGLDAPHNAGSSIGCLSCHDVTSTLPKLMPPWTYHDPPADIDDTSMNAMCWSCHDGVDAPHVLTHSSRNTSDNYGDWTVQCWVCHGLHSQDQLRKYGSGGYLYSSTSTGLTATTLSKTGAGWEVNAFANMLLVPNTANVNCNYTIIANTADTLTVLGPIDMSKAAPGITFAIVLGKLVRASVSLGLITDPLNPAAKTGSKTVRFFRREGANSFADGGITYDGICEVCHTETRHFRNDGGGDDPLHTNVGSVAGTDCIDCHSHENGFAHGGGSGTGCVDCHGHDIGTLFDPDMQAPYTPGSTASQGRGTVLSHSTHTETSGEDLKGPGIYCDSCHDITNFPSFKSGTDANSDGRYSLAETDVCDACHSSGGSYDGLEDPVIGAKEIWHTGAYVSTADSTLRAGKEKWCATCHDESPSLISGVTAPNVIGDEDGAYTYGAGWGYYKTGHGVPDSAAYPASGGVTAGAGVQCGSCHDFSAAHIDGLARTFDDGESSSIDAGVYRAGYRLNPVPMGQGTGTSTREPMLVPWKTNTANSANNYRLCVTCHDAGPFTDAGNMNTNLVTGGINRHEFHLVQNTWQYPADWNGGTTSLITCVNCHNVHGSTRLAMVRDGKLTAREPGLEIWYKNNAITTNIGTQNPPTPADLPLAASDGTAWIPLSATNICVGCHGSSILEGKDRSPFQNTAQAPTLAWTGETGYLSDGANPDGAVSGSAFIFRVEYTDTNNDPPAFISLLLDTDNDGTADATHALTGTDNGDGNYMNGRIFAATLSLTGNGVISYRFEASDGTFAASGSPTNWGTIFLDGQLNQPPVLSWVSDACRYQGVSPAAAASGANFEFRVSYTEADNTAPSLIQVWIDSNDNGTYEPGEKYDMTAVDPGDTNYADGKLYTRTMVLAYAGDGMLNYRFAAADGSDAATGEPVNVQSVSVIDTGLPLTTACGSGCDYPTIQTALDNTPQNGTVLVYPGTYGNIQLTNSGAGNQIDQGKAVRAVCGPDVTVISGGTQAVYVSNVTDIVVDGFGITGATWGVYLNAASATVSNSSIHDNVNNNVFPSNGGAGVYMTNAASTLTLADSEVYANTADNGAGLFLNGGSNPIIRNSVIRENAARSSGGGVFLQAGVLATFIDTAIRDNTADNYAGGVYFNGASAAFSGCSLTGNVATANVGGFAYMVNSASTAAFENCIIADNRGTQGGALYANNTGAVTVGNSTVANNQATSGNGGAFYNLSTDMTFRNAIAWGNTASSGSGHVTYFNSGSLTISDSLIASGNDGDFTNAPYIVGASGVVYTLDISGFMSDNDPLFVDAAAGNYHIRDISDAVDHAAAAYAPAVDIDGDTRPQGAAADIGADEYVAAAGRAVLSWTGEAGYTADGVDSDSIVSGASVIFRVDYTSTADRAPTEIQVWVDRDDNGTYGADEKLTLTETDPGDIDCTDGKRYALSLNLDSVPDGSIAYRFFATDGTWEAIGAPLAESEVTVLPPLPTAPTIGVPEALSADSIRWNFTDNATSEEGFKLLGPGETVKVVSATPDLAFLDEGELTANTRYTRHVQAYNVTGNSTSSANASRYTLSAPPNITADKTPATWYGTTDVVFTNAAGSGGGGVQYYRTAWDQNPAYIFTDSEPQWTSGTLTRSATASGSWYLHVKAFNGDGVGNGTSDYGPYSYDGTGPAAADLSPANGATGIDAASNLTFTLADGNSGVDWSTFQITLSGNKGYAKTYTSGSAQVSTTGTPVSYDVTVNPDTDFGDDEVITVTVAASDAVGNALAPPAWSFTTVGGILYCDVPSVSYPTIQAGIDAAPAACTVVRVTDGTYSERINFNGKAITVKSVNGAAATKIQGNNTNNQVVTFSSGETASSVLDGFTIDNQYTTASTLDRGISITAGAAPTIRNCIIQGNKLGTGSNGAGIYISGGSATIVNTTLGGDAANTNTCQYGCGLYAASLSAPLSLTGATVSSNAGTYGGGISLNATGQTTTISNTTFSNNTASLHGAAIYSNSPLVISGGSISNNTATQDGGGLHLTTASATASISGASLTGNTGRNGGAIFATGTGALTISDSTIDANTAATQYGAGIYLLNTTGASTITSTSISNNTGPGSGAGIYLNSSAAASLALTDCAVNGNAVTNTASYDGGGMYMAGTALTVNVAGGTLNGNSSRNGGGIYAASGNLNLDGAAVSSNTATANGGGLYVTGGATLTMAESTMRGNRSNTGGGGLRLVAATATITNCMITGNVSDGANADGGGFSNGGTAYVYNSTISGNYTTRYGGGLYGAGTVRNSIIWGNTSGGALTYYNIYGSPTVTASDIGPSQSTYEGSNGNINQPPEFIDLQQAASGNPTPAGNFHLCYASGLPDATCTALSPCIDTASSTNAPAHDFDGDPRPTDMPGIGDGIDDYDIGADEYTP